MKKALLIISIMCLVVGVSVFSIAQAAQEISEPVNSFEASKTIMDKICLNIDPSLDSFAEEEQPGVVAEALLEADGISTFLGKDPEGAFTLGEMQEVFTALTEGKGREINYQVNRGLTPEALREIFSAPSDTPLTAATFSHILGYLPNCESDRVWTYMGPGVSGLVGPMADPENPATQI